MIPILALRAVVLAALAGVQALSVVPAGDHTAVLIEVDGEVSYRHEMLTSPPRIVVDISGAEFRLPQGRFLDINRGGVLALRSSQFEAGVVRVVIDLAESVPYEVEQAGGIIRISFQNPSGPFDAWSSTSAAPAGARVPPVTGEGMLGRPVPDADRPGTPVPVTRPPAVEVVRQVPPPQQPPVWVEFRNTPIADVLSHFADFSGRSIIPGLGVGTQTITASIQGQPWDEALSAILQGQGLVARELPSGIVMVTSRTNMREQEVQEETVTRTFDVKYVSADSIAPQVRNLLASGGDAAAVGTVAINRSTNTLIVSARESVVDRIAALIPILDRRTPQVTIQARILFVNRTAIEGLGVRYEIKDAQTPSTQLNRLADGFGRDGPTSDDVIDLTGASIAAVGNATERIPNSTFEAVATLLLGRHSLITWFEAVERLNLSEVQAEPVVTVLDHRTARVQVGERTPIRVVDQGAAGADGPQASVSTEETGVILEVTPHVVGDQVLLQLHAERSLVLEASVDQGYRFGTQQTDTEILLDDGQTAVISGLTITDFLEERAGIPILMNLPLIGRFFRRTLEQEVKQDLLIMVTPYIERAGGI
ncbi:MAG TPA: AMIN domain-containing protein [Longimicrobiales bacterium]|nr:AMIN domain-containing protein [Longimicrobiales bacterium]